MEIPTIILPDIVDIETVEIPLPTADVPYYEPMVVPPSDLRAVSYTHLTLPTKA